MKRNGAKKKQKLAMTDQKVKGSQKRISIQEARKYFRKKSHQTLPITFWKAK